MLTLTPQKKKKGQRWTKDEHARYIVAIRELGITCQRPRGAKAIDWLAVHRYVGTRSPTQCKTHHQKMVKRYLASVADDGDAPDEDPHTEHSLRELAGLWVVPVAEQPRAGNETAPLPANADSLLHPRDWDFWPSGDGGDLVFESPRVANELDAQADTLPL